MVRTKLQFRAGRLELKDGTLRADEESGNLRLERRGDRTELLWIDLYDKTRQRIEIPKGGARAFRLSECQDGRAFVVKFKSLEPPFFFWIQDENWKQYGRGFLNQINVFFDMEREIPTSDRQGAQDITSKPIGLTQLLTLDNIKSILDREEDHNDLYSLIPPELSKTKGSLLECVSCPFFREALAMLDSAIAGGGVLGEYLVRAVAPEQDHESLDLNDILVKFRQSHQRK